MKDKLRSQNSDHDQENTTNQVKNAHFNKKLNIQNWCDIMMAVSCIMLGEPTCLILKEGWAVFIVVGNQFIEKHYNEKSRQ